MLIKDSHIISNIIIRNISSFVLFLSREISIPETRNKIDTPDPKAMSLRNERRDAADQVTLASFFHVIRD